VMEPHTPILRGRHPDAEDLLLYQSAELSGEQARGIAAHLAACAECRERIRRSVAVLDQVAHVRASAGRAVTARPRLAAFANWRWVRGAAVAAAGVWLVFFLGTGTTSARMDEFLSQGTLHEATVTTGAHKAVHVRSRLAHCYASSSESGRVLVGDAGEASEPCRQIDAAFQAAGWQWENALSLKAYQHWRASLSSKDDEMGRDRGLTVASTSTEAGGLLKATLWVRNADYHATSARFEFRDVGTVEVAETEGDELHSPAPPAAATENHLALHRPPAPEPVPLSRQLDEAELRVRIALRALDADANFETAVERDETGISVRGIARTDERRQAIDDALREIANVRPMVVTEAEEEQTQAPVTWMPNFQFTEPALAVKRLRQVFPDPAREQEFSDSVLALTRRLASYARAHDDLAAVLERAGAVPESGAAVEALSQLQAGMQSTLAEIGEQLAPLTGATAATAPALDAAQAMDLYREVYSLTFLSAPDHPGLEASLEHIRSLLGAAPPL